MSNILILASTPVTNQMEHTSSLTWLYLLPLPLILIYGIWKAAKVRRHQGPLKKVNAARMNQSQLRQEQEKLSGWREFVQRTGQSPCGGKSAEQAIEDQEALVRSLYGLQSDLHSELPEGGRKQHQPPTGR